MRKLLTSLLEAAGMSAASTGVWIEFGRGWGLIVAGAALIVTGVRNA